MNINEIRTLVRGDMQAVDQLIHHQLHSNVALINQLSNYIINSGGKRLRPVIVLLAANACGYHGVAHISTAAIIEFIHTATLLHDDVVDDSTLRRGRETANTIWGNEASVLVGDFLYSRSFQMMVTIRSMRVMDILANTTNTIAEGEVMQLLNCHDPDTTEEHYLKVIHCKTAQLFEAAARLGAVLADRPPAEELALAKYGMHLGTAFQLIDDILDYNVSNADIGKNIGDDLAEGKPTLPLIYAIRHSSSEETKLIREAILYGGRENLGVLIKIIEKTGAITYIRQLAEQEADLAISALNVLPQSSYKEALIGLAKFSVNRTY
jgi:octaprenyl-diphosphate synthase